MSLVETHINSYVSILRDRNARRDLKRRKEWEVIINRHFDTVVTRLGVPLCNELRLTKPSYKSEYNYDFNCTIFDLPCVLTVHRPYLSDPATLKFSTNINRRDVYEHLTSNGTIGEVLYALKAKADKLHKLLTMRESVWFPYYYYELTYSALCHEPEEGRYLDTFTADVTNAEPDEDGWYYVLNFAYASEEEHARPTKFTNVVKVVRMLAEEPDHSRDRVITMQDEESGDAYNVYAPRVGVESV